MTMKQIKLPVSGMTCAACAYNVQRALTAADGVIDVQVNRSPAYASVRYDPEQVTLPQLVRQVYGEGYGIVQDTVELSIPAMTSDEHLRAIEQVIKETQGVLNIQSNLADHRVQVIYIRGLTNRDELVKCIEDAGYSVLTVPQSDKDSGWMGMLKNLFRS